MSITKINEIWIDKNNLANTKQQDIELNTEDLTDDEVLLEVDSIGFSANNITYAVFGDKMGYWGFFPAAEGWGKVPEIGRAHV